MNLEITLTGMDEIQEIIHSEIKEALTEAGKTGVQYAKENGEYKNHTHNLRSGPGYGVVIDGNLDLMEVPSEAGHEEAKEKTENTIKNALFPGTGIIIADGMEYASYVEKKGYDVLSGAALHIEKKLQE